MLLNALFAKKPLLPPLSLIDLDKAEVVLIGAYRLLEQDGWTRKRFMDLKGYCLYTALDIGSPFSWRADRDPALIILNSIIGVYLPYDMIRWNDKWYRTKWHVLWVLRRAIKKVRKLREQYNND